MKYHQRQKWALHLIPILTFWPMYINDLMKMCAKREQKTFAYLEKEKNEREREKKKHFDESGCHQSEGKWSSLRLPMILRHVSGNGGPIVRNMFTSSSTSLSVMKLALTCMRWIETSVCMYNDMVICNLLTVWQSVRLAYDVIRYCRQ